MGTLQPNDYDVNLASINTNSTTVENQIPKLDVGALFVLKSKGSFFVNTSMHRFVCSFEKLNVM